MALRNSSDLVPLVCTEGINRKEEAQMGARPHTLWQRAQALIQEQRENKLSVASSRERQ